MHAVVIGAGLAGAATATHLARAGKSVVLLERDRAPTHKVCGEFLGRAACRELESLGVDMTALGAQWIKEMRLFSGNRSASAAVPFRAAGLSRFTLDAALRAVAVDAGVDLRYGARSTEARDGSVDLAGGETLTASAVIVATGKHEMRGLERRSVSKQKDSKLGIKEHLHLDSGRMAALGKSVELHFFQGGYAGLMPVDGDRANLSIAIDPAIWRAADLTPSNYRDWLCQTVPSLRERIQDAQPLFPKPLIVSGVPYGYRLWNAPADQIGLWRVGDQAIVTPSLTGEGMSLALGSARCLSDCLCSGGSQADYRNALQRRFGRQIRMARSFETILDHAVLRRGAIRALGLAPGALRIAARLTRSA